MGEFPDQGDDTLIPLSLIEAAERRPAPGPREIFAQETDDAEGGRMPKTGRPHPSRRALGVDVARYGSDFTVFTIIEAIQPPGSPAQASPSPDSSPSGADKRAGGPPPSSERNAASWPHAALLLIRRRGKKGVTEVAAEAEQLAREWAVDVIAVDDTGVGGGVTDILAEAGLKVLPVLFGGATSDAQSFLNLKAEMFWKLRRAFETGAVHLDPPDGHVSRLDLDALVGQLSAMKYEFRPKGMRIVDPDEAGRKRPGGAQGPVKSPDHAHSFALAWWAACGVSAAESVLVNDPKESPRYTRRRFY